MAKNDSFKQAIKAYLDKRAEEDSLFAPKYANEKKSIDECCSYIMGEARKRGNAIAISDEEVYGMAAHYYDGRYQNKPAACRRESVRIIPRQTCGTHRGR